MAKKVTIEGSNLLQNLDDDWGGVNNSSSAQTIHGTSVPAGAEWGINRGEVERFVKTQMSSQQTMTGYYTCATAAGTAAKTVAASGYALTVGGCIRIKMNNANTANNVTLNINSTGAKALYYDGAQASATNTWEAGEVLEVYYDGTQYQCASGGSRFATGESVNDTSITNTIAEGSSALPTSGAVFEKTKAIDEIAGRVPPAYSSGKYLNGSGVLVTDVSWKVIDFINVPALAAGDVIVWGGITSRPAACICFYDENGAFKNAKSATGSSRTITLGSSDAALGSVKIRASFLESGTPSLTLNGSDVIAANTHYQINGFTELQEDVEALNEEVPKLIEFDEAAADLVYNMVDYDTWDTSGTSGTRVKFIYRNILGATVKVKCESGYSFGIAYYAGSNPSGSALFDTGWKTEETTVNVPASGVGSLTINTRKSNNTAITYDESIANVIKVVYVGTRKVVNEVMKDSGDLITGRAVYKAVNGGSFPYSGGRIRLTDYYCDGQLYMAIRHPSADTSGQGGGIYGDYFIQGGNGGYVRVYDLVTKEIVVDSMPLGSVDSNNHVNNIVFGKTIPDGGTFPYMYVSECKNQRRCFVENFSLTGSTLVQTLGYDDSNMKDSNWVVDNEGGYMYLIGNYINSDTVRVIKLPFVEPTLGNHTYTPSDIIDYFDLDGSVGKAYIFQGNVIKDGKLYSCFGGSGNDPHKVWINDLDSHKLLNVIELDQITGGECESINLYNGTMMIGYPNQGKLYQLIF